MLYILNLYTKFENIVAPCPPFDIIYLITSTLVGAMFTEKRAPCMPHPIKMMIKGTIGA
jgi:hypothetical protein